MKNCKLLILLTVIFIYNESCKKNPVAPSSNGNLLSEIKITSEVNGKVSVSVLNFEYNSQNKLIAINVDGSPGYTQLICNYDLAGRLGTSTSILPGVSEHIARYIYDQGGRIIQKIDSSVYGNLVLDNHIYAYDMNNNLIADSIPNMYISGIAAYTKFQYSNNNIVQTQFYYYQNGTFQVISSNNYAYSDKLNPFLQNAESFYFTGIYDAITSFSRNFYQIKSSSYPITYSYYSEGLPREMHYSYNDQGTTGSYSEEYFYK